MKNIYLAIVFISFSLTLWAIGEPYKPYGKEIEYVKLNDPKLIKNINAYRDGVLKGGSMDQAILIESNYKKKANRILMKPIVHMARIADSLPPYYTTIRNITVFLREKPIKSEVVAKVSTDSLFKKVFNYGYVYLRKYGYYSFPNMCDCDIWEFIDNELVAIGLWENDLKSLYTPETP